MEEPNLNIAYDLGGEKCVELLKIYKQNLYPIVEKRNEVNVIRFNVTLISSMLFIVIPFLVALNLMVNSFPAYADSILLSVVVCVFALAIYASKRPKVFILLTDFALRVGIKKKAYRDAKQELEKLEKNEKPTLRQKIQSVLEGDSVESLKERISRNENKVLENGNKELEQLMEEFSYPELFYSQEALTLNQSIQQRFQAMVKDTKREINYLFQHIKDEDLI